MVSFDIDDMCIIESGNNSTQLVCGKELSSGETFDYNGDPNFAENSGSPSQKKLYEVDQGSILLQDCGAWWLKSNLPNKWTQIGGSVHNGQYSTIIKKLSPGDSQIFFRLNYKSTKTFKWKIEVVGNDIYNTFKLSTSVYNKEVLVNKYDSLGNEVNIDINVYLEDGHIILKIKNNEDSTLLCTAKAITL